MWSDFASDTKELKASGKSLAVARWSGGVGSTPNSARQSFSEIKSREAKKPSSETAVSTRFSNGAVSEEKNFYHCFACEKSGSSPAYLIEVAGMTFVEAVEQLGRMQGVDFGTVGASPEE